jgi:thiamine-phosphate pyrophosphorylase
VNDRAFAPAARLPRLNTIVDFDVARQAGWMVRDLARACLAGGARFLQIRAKHLPSGLYLALCDEVMKMALPYEALVIVNDRADVACLCGAAGVHVGQEDLVPRDIRVTIGDSAIVGWSTHTVEQVRAAIAEPVDYIAVGPVFGTGTKKGAYAPVGLDFVREAAAVARTEATSASQPMRPLVAIGGITLDRARAVIEAGASSVAVISDLLVTGDPESRVREYLRALE